jgi:pyruvate-formate lyase
MKTNPALSRRQFLRNTSAALGGVGLASLVPSGWCAGIPHSNQADLLALRRAILDSPLGVSLHRARVFTEVFRKNESLPWEVRKAMALREYFRTVPLYLRPGDRLAGSISETPGAMPLMAELGFGEAGTALYPKSKGYLKGKVPPEIWEYWKTRNLWGQLSAANPGHPAPVSPDSGRLAPYKFISNQGHLSPSYGELLKVGFGGVLKKVRARQVGETDPAKVVFLTAAEQSLLGVSEWIRRYGEFLPGDLGRIAARVATEPPTTFHEAMQLIWFAHQAIHIEGHGWSCTPDHIDRLLLPFYEADKQAGRLTDAQALALCENFVLKMRDNTYWGPLELTQGLCVGGSTPDGQDLTNRLSWLFIEGGTNMALPEPLLWIRWHPSIDQKFFDFCLTRIARHGCFPLMWNDTVVAAGFMNLGVSRDDAYNYLAVGCNELAIPGQTYFNPGASANYLRSLELALTSGKGYRGNGETPLAPPVAELATFECFAAAMGAYLRSGIERSYRAEMQVLKATMEWGRTPYTSCFFDGCIERGRDMALGTKYNILSCGGVFFANAVDCLAAIREVVYEKKLATLQEVATACAADFKGHERLRAKLQAAPKHGNDDPRLDDLITLVQRMRDEPLKEICRDPRDGSKFGNTHITKAEAALQGRMTPATPDGRRAGTPLASSVAAAAGSECSGPTAVLNSVAKLDAAKSWQSGYQVNVRFQNAMLADPATRTKVRAMLNVYFAKGGQELQINSVDSETLRAAQKDPTQYRDLVVRVAGFSAFFVSLTPELQEEIIARTAHM